MHTSWGYKDHKQTCQVWLSRKIQVFETRLTWATQPASPLVKKDLILSTSYFSHPWNGTNTYAHKLWKINMIIHMKHLIWCLTYSAVCQEMFHSLTCPSFPSPSDQLTWAQNRKYTSNFNITAIEKSQCLIINYGITLLLTLITFFQIYSSDNCYYFCPQLTQLL